MKRLLRVSFDILITSIVPILSWFLLGIFLDKNLINIFSLTYPLQCIMGMIVSIFGVGANITQYKNGNQNMADNGIFYGIVFSMVCFGGIILKHKSYIDFMNMDRTIYQIFCIFYITQIFFHTILK